MYQCIACDYYGTGEGRTVCLLITRVYPNSVDFDEEQKVKNEFIEIFGEFWARMAENIEIDEFVRQYESFLHPPVLKVLKNTGRSGPGNFKFYQEFHVNYS